MSDDEQRVVERAIHGDRVAFNALVQRHHGAVYRFACRYSRQDAADITQETFMRAFVHRERFELGRPVLPWLFTIARRLCIDGERKLRPIASDTLDPAEPRADAEESLGSREQLALLRKAHAALAEGPREAVALYHWENMSYDEIATTLGVPIGTVMTWLHRGRAQLRKALAEGAPQ
jgi:RNA polymerase sigma-70 factor (ECF subfamily)